MSTATMGKITKYDNSDNHNNNICNNNNKNNAEKSCQHKKNNNQNYMPKIIGPLTSRLSI